MSISELFLKKKKEVSNLSKYALGINTHWNVVFSSKIQ